MANDPLPFDIGYILRERAGHAVALGLAYQAHGADWVEFSMDYDRRLISDLATGILASGPIVSLMDQAMGTAIFVKRGVMASHATLDLRLDYLRPAKPGRRVTGHGECYKLTRRVGFARGIAHDGNPDDPIAHATATFMLGPDAWGAHPSGRDE